MMKPILIAIVGKSGSGKTSLALYLEEAFNVPTIASYTTRPMRIGEVDGRDHIFVGLDKIPAKAEMFAYTLYGGHHYWSLLSQFQEHPIASYIVDEKGLEEIRNNHLDKFQLISVLVVRQENPTELSRVERDKNRLMLDESTYDVVIENNATLDCFFKQAVDKLSFIIIK